MLELLHKLYIWIYCLEPQALALYAVYVTLVFSAFCRAYGSRRWLRPLLATALACCLVCVLWSTVLSRSAGEYRSFWFPLHTYLRVLQGDTTELLRSAVMNVVLFFPAGLIIAALMPRISLRQVLVGFALFSLGIELSQDFFSLGFAEIDDVLHNTLGAVLGCVGYRQELDIDH